MHMFARSLSNEEKAVIVLKFRAPVQQLRLICILVSPRCSNREHVLRAGETFRYLGVRFSSFLFWQLDKTPCTVSGVSSEYNKEANWISTFYFWYSAVKALPRVLGLFEEWRVIFGKFLPCSSIWQGYLTCHIQIWGTNSFFLVIFSWMRSRVSLRMEYREHASQERGSWRTRIPMERLDLWMTCSCGPTRSLWFYSPRLDTSFNLAALLLLFDHFQAVRFVLNVISFIGPNSNSRPRRSNLDDDIDGATRNTVFELTWAIFSFISAHRFKSNLLFSKERALCSKLFMLWKTCV